jgi:FAD/FMN-containing dehydrogenase
VTAPSVRSVGLTGRVVRPGDDEYAVACAGWNRLFTHAPSAVVFAVELRDVVNAVTFARHHDLPLRVRSGGHCLEGWSNVDGGVVIDVSGMKSVTIDAESRTATVGAGVTQSEAVTRLGAAGLAAPTGTEGSVSLAGATLGGGFGLLTRRFGMACDSLLAAEVVVASRGLDADVVAVDGTNHADLLWALRGAGNGSLGIVTSLTYRVHALSSTTFLTASWPGLLHLDELFPAWQRLAPYADNRLTSQLEIRRDEIVLFGVLASGSDAEATQMLSPLLSVGSPDVSVRTSSWVDTYAGLQIPISEEPANWKFRSHFVSTPFPPEAVSLIGSFMAKAPTSHCNYFTNALGGAVPDSEPVGGSAFAHRNALFYAEPGAGWGTRGAIPTEAHPLTPTALSWVAEFGQALEPYVDGAYVNVPNAGMPDWATAYWGSGVDQLRAVKARYDPDDVFRYEQSIQLP